jgi:hypothetical protein
MLNPLHLTFEEMAGYAHVKADILVRKNQIKRLLGMPYLRLNECHAIWAYCFQLGCILGAQQSVRFYQFGLAFLGTYRWCDLNGVIAAEDPSMSDVDFSTQKKNFAKDAEYMISKYEIDSMTFFEYVCAEFIKQIGHPGDPKKISLHRSKEKMSAKKVKKMANVFTQQGASLGCTYPDKIKNMHDRTHLYAGSESFEEIEYRELKDYFLWCNEHFPECCSEEYKSYLNHYQCNIVD